MSSYTATREFFDPLVNDSLGNFGPYWKYNLYKEEKLTGEFFYKNVKSFFKYTEQTFLIHCGTHFFSRRSIPITGADDVIAGTYHFSFYKKLFRNQIGKLKTAQSENLCFRSRHNVLEAKFLSSTRKESRDFRFETERGVINYHSLYDFYNDESSNGSGYTNLTLNIDAEGDNIFYILAGIFIIEQSFQN